MSDRPAKAESVPFRPNAAFWQGLFDIHLDPLAFIDENFRVVRGNMALAKALGCRQEEIAGRFCYELFHGADRPVENCPHVRLLADGCEHACETSLNRLGGAFWISVTPVFDNTGQLVGCLHIARNVTAYKTLEAELRAARAEVEARAEKRALELSEHLQFEQVLVSLALSLGRALADSDVKALVQQGVADIGAAGKFGRCVFWKLTGDAATEMAFYEDPRHDLPPASAEPSGKTAVRLLAQSGGAGVSETTDADVERCAVIMRPHGPGDAAYALVAERRLSASAVRMALFSERLSLLCQIMGDALQRQAGVLESQRLREELSNLDQMARMGQLSAALAHELNQPLAATLCNAQAAARLLRQPRPDIVEACSALDDIISSARRAGEVMRYTRALFKGHAPVYQRVDLPTLVTAALKLLQNEVAFADATVLHRESPVPPVMGNVVQLQQVVINLVRNALEAVSAAPRGSRTVTLSTQSGADGAAVLCVRDSGPGVKAGDEERIFQPFHTDKPDGTGLGLAICRQIITQHGGTIVAARVPEGGGCFTVTLPACSAFKS